jgi:DNA-binding NarL/FixJ family response regulator
MTILIGIADDHQSFLTSISLLINSFSGMRVVLQAHDGQDLLDKMAISLTMPVICLIDVNMPVLNGPVTALKMAAVYPGIRTMAMSMEEDDGRLISMLTAGCRGWWPKHFNPEALEQAILELHQTGYYNADPFNIAFRQEPGYTYVHNITLSREERQLLELSCTPFTLEEIRISMGLREDSLHDLYQTLYARLHVRTRIGAVLEAMRRGIGG